MSTRNQGQNEYAKSEEDVLANFKRIAVWQGRSQEDVLMTYMLKHIDGILAYVDGHTSQREDIRGRITDVMVYCMLLWAMVEDGKIEQDEFSSIADIMQVISERNDLTLTIKEQLRRKDAE
jgi:hypothetical protein